MNQMPYLTEDEKYFLHCLQEYGPLTRAQLTKLLNKSSVNATDKVFMRLRNQRLIENISGGYYIGLNKCDKANDKTIRAMWVFLYFAKEVERTHHCSGDYPGQIFFLKGGFEYQIITVEKGLEYELSLLKQPNDIRKNVIVLPSFEEEDKKAVLKFLPNTPCVFATLDYKDSGTEPIVRFCLPKEGSTDE